MPSDASYINDGTTASVATAPAAVQVGELNQLADGGPGIFGGSVAAAIGDPVFWRRTGKAVCPKGAGYELLDGGRAYWDYANSRVYFRRTSGRDYYLGRVVGNAASADTTCTVDVPRDPRYDFDLTLDGVISALVGTPAVGSAAARGFGLPYRHGGAHLFDLSLTNEAQKVDALAVDPVDAAANWIAEFVLRIPNGGATATPDFNVGLGNGTNAADADAITRHLFMHVDGASAAIKFQSTDGTTTVAATDSTKTFTAGSALANRFEVWLDGRDPTNVKIYVEGVRVLSSTVFNLSAYTGLWYPLVHLEKTASAEVFSAIVDRFTVRTAKN